MKLTDINHIKALLARHGFRFSKGMGQNFLCDASVPCDIAAGAGIDENTFVLEVGPGIGALTQALCERAKHVTAVELDRRLFPLLGETMSDTANFTLVEGDILKTDIAALVAEQSGGARAVAAANLPYYITSPAISALIDSHCFDSITVMVQKEVARRICAAPGTSDYGAFTLYIAYHAAAGIILDVPRTCFIPQPNVDSAVVRLDILTQSPVSCDREKLFSVIKASFAQRRKTLQNCLASAFTGKITKNEIENLLINLGIPPTVRGEALNIFDFARIAEKMPD